MCRIFLVVTTALLAVTPSSFGQQFSVNHSCFPSHNVHVAPQIHHAVPFVHHGHGVNKIIVNEVVQPILVAVPVVPYAVPANLTGVPYYYSASDAYASRAAIRDILRDELRNFNSGNNAAPTPGGAEPRKAAPPAKSEKPAPSELEDTSTPAELATNVTKVLTTHCAACHGGGKTSGNFRLVSDGGKLLELTKAQRWQVYAMAQTGAMPPAAANDAKKLVPVPDLQQLLSWAAQR